MSLSISLKKKRWTSYDEGKTYTEDKEQVYWANITHNLNIMAEKAGIYKALWCPEDINKINAGEIIELLQTGLKDLKERPEYFKQFNAPNGWGLYEHFVPFVEEYLKACKKYPDAIIEVSK